MKNVQWNCHDCHAALNVGQNDPLRKKCTKLKERNLAMGKPGIMHTWRTCLHEENKNGALLRMGKRPLKSHPARSVLNYPRPQIRTKQVLRSGQRHEWARTAKILGKNASTLNTSPRVGIFTAWIQNGRLFWKRTTPRLGPQTLCAAWLSSRCVDTVRCTIRWFVLTWNDYSE
jgi:hypothetical protein